MKVAPRLLLAMVATLGAAGCRTAGTNSIAHSRPPQPPPRTAFDLQAFVAEHNENAARVRSIEARPSIVVKISPPGERSQEGRVDGRLALERPRNFKLELSHIRSTVADIGSNDERFWFWFSNKKDKSVYVCNYEDLASTSLAVTYQPDWIAESLGLREIGPDEAARIKVRPGPQPGTTALSFPAARSGSQASSRLMIVSDRTRRISEFRVFTPDGKALLAQATIPRYRELPLPADRDSASGEGSCYLPENLVLEWTREHISLEVVLRDVKLNEFDPARRTALFVEPSPEGYARVNIAEVARQQPPEGATAIRETIPPPEPKKRSRQAPTLEIRGASEAANLPRSEQPARPRSDVILPVLDLDVVGAPIPTAPGEPRPAGYSSLATGPGMSLER
jgi:hypothetical protein